MKFVVQEDVEAPIEYVFGQVTDFTSMERSALRRGADVQRLDDLQEPGVGMKWEVAFSLRGKRRKLRMKLTELDAPNGMQMALNSPNISGTTALELVALSRSHTRITAQTEVKAKSLAAKLILQSAKLARGNITRRIQKRMAEYAKDLEERYKSVA